MMRENLESEYKVSLCRQVSPSKSNTRKKPERQQSKTKSQLRREKNNPALLQNQDEQLKLPAEVIREIDRMVAKRMRKEFPIKQFTPKKDRMMIKDKDSNTLSWREIEN